MTANSNSRLIHRSSMNEFKTVKAAVGQSLNALPDTFLNLNEEECIWKH